VGLRSREEKFILGRDGQHDKDAKFGIQSGCRGTMRNNMGKTG
jgi:hypothetical protein